MRLDITSGQFRRCAATVSGPHDVVRAASQNTALLVLRAEEKGSSPFSRLEKGFLIEKNMSKRILGVVAGVVVLAGAGVAYVAYMPPAATDTTVNASANTNIEVSAATISTSLAVVNDSVNLTYDVTVPQGTTAYEQIMQAAQQNNFVVEKKDYDFGPLITGIGGKVVTGNAYWSFEVNGVAATEGVGTYVLAAGDAVTMRYMP